MLRLKRWFRFFPLWTFHLYVKKTFQQHLLMEFIFLRWYNISELVVNVRLLLIWAFLNQGSLVVRLKSPMQNIYCRHHDLVKCFRILMATDTNSAWRSNNPVLLALFMTIAWLNKSNTTDSTNGAWTAYPTGETELAPNCYRVHVVHHFPLHVFTFFFVPCCDCRYDLCAKTIFGSF